MNIEFIINPIAGKGKGKYIEEKVKAHFHDGDTVKIHYTAYPGHAVIITQKILLRAPDIIVACGGDGTINEVAHSLIHSAIPLGIIPIGSGNGLAAHLKIPKNTDKALQLLKKANTVSIDAGQVNRYYFFSNMGLGIDAAVIGRYEKVKQRNLWGYIKAGLWGIRNYRPAVYKVVWEEKLLKYPFFFLFCSNSNEAGYGISFTPKAKINDGLLDVLCVESLTFTQQLYFSLLVLIRKIHTYRKAVTGQISSLEIESSEPKLYLQIDGEYKTIRENKIKIAVVKNAITVIIP